MADPIEESRLALEYYKALRTEIVSRFEMRDKVILGYLAAIGTLLTLGFSKLDSSGNENLLSSLLVVVPFLSLGALSMVAQHQDQVTAYYQYFCTELRSSFSEKEQTVPMFYLSRTAQEHTGHILWMLFMSRFLIMCGPSIFVIFLNAPYFYKGWTIKEYLLIVGLALTILTALRTEASRRHRGDVMKRLFSQRDTERL
jgi:hypothetical protein